MLFSQVEVAAVINANFEPAWESVRSAPLVRIDFGNGTTVTRTLHGNIASYVCNAEGKVLDILPGMYHPPAYLEKLKQLRLLADYVVQEGKAGETRLREYHEACAKALHENEVPPVFLDKRSPLGGGVPEGAGGFQGGQGGAFQGSAGGFQGGQGGGFQSGSGQLGGQFGLKGFAGFQGIANAPRTAPTWSGGYKGGFGGYQGYQGGFQGTAAAGFRGTASGPQSGPTWSGGFKGGIGGNGGFQGITTAGFQGIAIGPQNVPMRGGAGLPPVDPNAQGDFDGGIETPLKILLVDGPRNGTALPPVDSNLEEKISGIASAEDRAIWDRLEEDVWFNETVRRLQIHEHLTSAGLVKPEVLKKWVYKEVLHADLEDPYLGLYDLLFANYPFAKEDHD